MRLPARGSVGFDSIRPIVDAGLTPAGGEPPSFWARALSPCSQASPLDAGRDHAVAECRALWDSGARHLVPVMEAPRAPATRIMGVTDAMTFCHALRNVYNWVAPLEVPSSSVVYAFLAPPSRHPVSLSYWQGWAGYVHGFRLGGGHPLYPCIRVDAEDIDATCRAVNHAAAPDCWGLWAVSSPSEHATVASPWSPPRCLGPFPATLLWRVAGDGDALVGVDRTAPTRAVIDGMLVLLDRP